PKTQVPSLLSLMDLLFIGWRKNPLYRFGISPNKIFDYEMSGKPIVHAVEAANDPVAEAGCGISVEPENAEAIADAIMKLKVMPADELQRLGSNGHQYVLQNHTYSVLANKFINVMEDIRKTR
ncbi:MAG: glycosyltransferase WbuB, partial [Bacteroidales bacterium]|nr:glycosyltransferase WbuB [Bacteroidales bacterium]